MQGYCTKLFGKIVLKKSVRYRSRDHFGSSLPFSLEISVFWHTVCFGVVVLICVSRRHSGDSSSFRPVCFCCIDGSMGGDGFQTQRRKSRVPGKIRDEKVLALATTIGRKEWIGKFCSETNVWTRWRCRRCFSNIPAGLQREHKEAVFVKNKEWCSPRVIVKKGENSPQGAWDHIAEEMLLQFTESGHPIFRATTPLSRGQLKSKGRGKLSIHFTADQDTVDTICRIFLSVNQLSVYGAVAAVCEEFEDHQDRTGQPVILV